MSLMDVEPWRSGRRVGMYIGVGAILLIIIVVILLIILL
jgi:hypothetical protein